jgi:hypothetical protein
VSERLRCRACGRVWISSAGRAMVAEGRPCSDCGGSLELIGPEAQAGQGDAGAGREDEGSRENAGSRD